MVTRKWAQHHAAQLPSLIRALLRACAFCDDPQNHTKLVNFLAKPEYLDAAPELVDASLNLEKTFTKERSNRSIRPSDWRLRSFSPDTTFPSATHSLWLLREMKRWHQLQRDEDEHAIAARCVETAAYRAAAASMGIACPGSDFPPMPLRNGMFDPAAQPVSKGVSHVI